jgi:UDP-N-acetylmuramate--alanine ligase
MKNLDENSDSNFIHGKSKYFVVEACEYRRSFLNLYPTILAITNIEEDHLDYYADISDIQSAFRELAQRIPKDGCIVCNQSDARVKPVLENVQCAVINYIPYVQANLTLAVPGKHNRLNAGVALAITEFLGVPKERAIESISHFRGTWRRFDYKGKTKRDTLLYDDYAHHPTEIRATLQGLREMFPNKKRVLFFQPHQYSRTKLLFSEFLKSFDDADVVYILPIFPARESFDPSITSQMLVEQINDSKVRVVSSLTEAEEIIQTQDENTVVMTMGAGNVYTICENVIR